MGLRERSVGHWALVGLGCATLIGFAVLRVFTTPDPRGHSTHEQLGLPACRMLDWTGIPCPGCGVTTSLSLFAHGEPLGALHSQPFGFLLAIAALLLAAWTGFALLCGKDAWQSAKFLARPWLLWASLGAMLAAWAYKIGTLSA